MQLSENQTFVRNGYERQILTDNGKSVLIKTIGTPACRTVGRPPKSGGKKEIIPEMVEHYFFQREKNIRYN